MSYAMSALRQKESVSTASYDNSSHSQKKRGSPKRSQNSNNHQSNNNVQTNHSANRLKQQPAIPSFITQVNRNGQPQRFDDEDESTSTEDELRIYKKSSLFERLCKCLKFNRVPNDEEVEEESDPEESKQNHPSPPQASSQQQQPQMQMANQNQAQGRAKQRGPLQTNTPQVILPQDHKYHGKKVLVIDLDETLVHSSFTMITNADFTLKITVQNMPFTVYVKKRPGCEFFLEELSKYYELIIYTASLCEYADPVMDTIDKNRVCSLRLFRENCTLYNGVFVKDLSLMSRDLKDLIIIDNSETSFLFQPANAVHIKSYFDDIKDRELYRLIPFFIFLSNSFDVRHVGNWWREFETNDFVDYRDKKNRLQRLDKLKMLEELGDLREREMQQQVEADSLQSSQVCLNSPDNRESFDNNSPKDSAQPLHRNEIASSSGSGSGSVSRPSRKQQKDLKKPPLMIEVPDPEEIDNLAAARELVSLESVRNKLLKDNHRASPLSAGIKKNHSQRFNEFEDYKRGPSNKTSWAGDEDPFSFKTQPDAVEEDSESYKEMKQIFDNIRYSYNNQNINSPVSKERFAQLLHSNSHRKITEKISSTNASAIANGEHHFFTSVKRMNNVNQQAVEGNILGEAKKEDDQKPSILLAAQKFQQSNDDEEYQLEITAKDNEDIAIIGEEDAEEDGLSE